MSFSVWESLLDFSRKTLKSFIRLDKDREIENMQVQSTKMNYNARIKDFLEQLVTMGGAKGPAVVLGNTGQ